MSYQEEMIILFLMRTKSFYSESSKDLKGNTLVVSICRKHEEVLYDMMFNTDMKNMFMCTDTNREVVRETRKNKEDTILASYGTFSTGVNIKKIDNIVFASPSKSRIRNLQSIGRGLRKTEGKDSMRPFDIADDLQCENYTLNHLKERINIYNEENFPYNIKQFDLK